MEIYPIAINVCFWRMIACVIMQTWQWNCWRNSKGERRLVTMETESEMLYVNNAL